MKKNKIFRGASLDQITFDDALYMEKELGIHYILDYRDEKESLMSQDIVFPNAIYERIAALQVKEATDEGFDFGSMLQGEMTLEKLKFLLSYVSEGYKTMAFDNPAYHKLFELLLRNDGHVYFHCTAGKDRTGITAALLLDLMGCHEYDIVKDYSESYENNIEINEELAKMMENEEAKQYLKSSPRYMMELLDYLREHYGSSKEYLLQIGLKNEEIEQLIENFTI